MKPLVFVFPENKLLGAAITQGIDAEEANYTLRNFPDGETYLRVFSPVENREVIIVCSLNQPDGKFLSLYFLCKLVKELKAKSICLVVPYLSYMRQDKIFHPGEALTSSFFAQLLSSFINRLITVDPHLHRRKSMQEIYTIPCDIIHATEPITQWINEKIPNAILIGPDEESEQWISDVSKQAGVPYHILEKTRYGDRDVKLILPSFEKFQNHTPILIDDIISTAHTMIETVRHLKSIGMRAPICIGVHGIFAQNAFEELLAAGVSEVVTTNSITHITNKIDISNLLTDCLKKQINK